MKFPRSSRRVSADRVAYSIVPVKHPFYTSIYDFPIDWSPFFFQEVQNPRFRNRKNQAYLVIHLSRSLLCKNHLAAARDMLRGIPGQEPLAMGLI